MDGRTDRRGAGQTDGWTNRKTRLDETGPEQDSWVGGEADGRTRQTKTDRQTHLISVLAATNQIQSVGTGYIYFCYIEIYSSATFYASSDDFDE